MLFKDKVVQNLEEERYLKVCKCEEEPRRTGRLKKRNTKGKMYTFARHIRAV
jgi:hypothetical protein